MVNLLEYWWVGLLPVMYLIGYSIRAAENIALSFHCWELQDKIKLLEEELNEKK